ncbi:MAG: 4Fe-4S dicluster domain-containing protein [Deltaproteobacteria bacterium]|nr:4Fe-4S dicluster domain-containing protein [Deltaproteobacteria bacterium]
MSVFFDKDICQGCGECLSVCPGDLIALDGNSKAYLPEPRRCWSCAACLKKCPFSAPALYLPPALGGRGAFLTAKRLGEKTLWTYNGPEGTRFELTSDSNKTTGY